MRSEWKTTACPHDCPCACTMRARSINNKIEMKPHEKNRWTEFICPKGLRYANRVFDPGRLRTPLLRSGSGWEELTWEKAWSIWADKVSSGISESGPLSLMYYSSAGSMYFSKTLIPHIFNELGGYTGTKGSLCSSIGSSGLKEATLGWGVPFLTPELQSEAKGIMLWGRNSLVTQPQIRQIFRKIRDKGGEIASLEIRNTETSEAADRSWYISPGGDFALAAWLCKKLISMGVSSNEWKSRVVNYEEFLVSLKSLEEEKLLDTAGIDETAAEEILLWLIKFSPVTYMPSYGSQRYLHGDMQFKWMFALSVISGGFEDPRSGLSFGKDEHALFPKELIPRSDNVRKFGTGTMGKEILDASPKISVLHITTADPVMQNPGSSGIVRAMRSVPFKVCTEIFMTETAKECDLVLPAATYLEEDHDWLGSYWHSFLVRSERIVEPQGMVKSDIEIFNGLAKTLGLKTDLVKLYEEMDRLMLSEKRLEKVSEGLYEWKEPIYWTDPGTMAKLPECVPVISLPEEGELRLVTFHVKEYINGHSFDAPNIPDIPDIYMSAADMKKLDLTNSERVVVYSRNGEHLIMCAVEESSLREGLASAKQGVPGINLLTEAQKAPGCGAPYAECFIRVKKAL
ncbi:MULTISPECIES: molybdopterin-containing oxidoreductase family protein [Synergistaceae]|uniref:molybdopterin-containing oxidoreductase family protein n=1 Tax=Synergistaceae TaxID=649777 RepID=UPI003AEE17BC|nr:molybdopterin-dependent oxidoreductase [Synergistaceae bacterium DZ-S4]